MARIFLSLGTNLGDKRTNLANAVALLGELVGELIQVSDDYESAPWGFESEHSFLNNVLEMTTELSPMEVLKTTQKIETRVGRTSKSHSGYADRLIDIDILFYNDLIVDLPELQIPHPLIAERDFVLIPLCQIAADYIHPQLNCRISALAARH